VRFDPFEGRVDALTLFAERLALLGHGLALLLHLGAQSFQLRALVCAREPGAELTHHERDERTRRPSR
jgi:hypothetical protein